MLTDYDNRSGPFSRCIYTRQSDLFAQLPSEEITAYVNSPDVKRELDVERLRQCVQRPPADIHFSAGYLQIKSRVHELLERQGYVRPPFTVEGAKQHPSKQLVKFAIARIAEHGGGQIEFDKARSDWRIRFRVDRPYLDAAQGTIEFRSLTRDVKLHAAGGGLQPFGFYLRLQQEYLNGLFHCMMWGFVPDPDFDSYLRFDDGEAQLGNLIDLIFAQLSYF